MEEVSNSTLEILGASTYLWINSYPSKEFRTKKIMEIEENIIVKMELGLINPNKKYNSTVMANEFFSNTFLTKIKELLLKLEIEFRIVNFLYPRMKLMLIGYSMIEFYNKLPIISKKENLYYSCDLHFRMDNGNLPFYTFYWNDVNGFFRFR